MRMLMLDHLPHNLCLRVHAHITHAHCVVCQWHGKADMTPLGFSSCRCNVCVCVLLLFAARFPPWLQTFFVDDDLKEACQLDAVLTVVDSKHLVQHLDEVKPADVVNEAGGGPQTPCPARVRAGVPGFPHSWAAWPPAQHGIALGRMLQAHRQLEMGVAVRLWLPLPSACRRHAVISREVVLGSLTVVCCGCVWVSCSATSGLCGQNPAEQGGPGVSSGQDKRHKAHPGASQDCLPGAAAAELATMTQGLVSQRHVAALSNVVCQQPP